jgi:NAD(P)-dependent dehydrogenase (short-subunit alcohol dehydrogenase family)
MDDTGVHPYPAHLISQPVDTTKPIPYTSLKSRTVVITGGASGIGAAIATLCAEHGANVIIGDINLSQAESLIATLRQTTSNPHHHALPLDVTSWPSQFTFFQTAASLSPHKGIDTVIANAGVSDYHEGKLFQQPPDYTTMSTPPPPPPNRTVTTNLTGVLYTTHLALSYLSHNPNSTPTKTPTPPRDRHLLLVASIAGLAAVPTVPLYAAAKHGVVGLFRALRATTPSTTGVRTNLLLPYFVNTPILGPEGPLVMAGAALAEITDVRDAAVRFIADQSISGSALMVGARPENEDMMRKAGLDWVDGDTHGNCVREVLLQDWEQTDVFVRRMIAVTNLSATARGWGGWVADVLGFFVARWRGETGRS